MLLEYEEVQGQLVRLSNYLDRIDHVRDGDEHGKKGFNREDRLIWWDLKASFLHLTIPPSYLQILIRPYTHKLIQANCIELQTLRGLLTYKDPERCEQSDASTSYEVDELNNLVVQLNHGLEKERFEEYINIHKKYNFKFDGLKKVWYLQNKDRPSFDIPTYLLELQKIGIYPETAISVE